MSAALMKCLLPFGCPFKIQRESKADATGKLHLSVFVSDPSLPIPTSTSVDQTGMMSESAENEVEGAQNKIAAAVDPTSAFASAVSASTSAPAIPRSAAAEYRVKVTLVEGEQLLAADKNNKSDPYCDIRLEKERFSFSVQKSTLRCSPPLPHTQFGKHRTYRHTDTQMHGNGHTKTDTRAHMHKGTWA